MPLLRLATSLIMTMSVVMHATRYGLHWKEIKIPSVTQERKTQAAEQCESNNKDGSGTPRASSEDSERRSNAEGTADKAEVDSLPAASAHRHSA